MFHGPPGTGKTSTINAIANMIYGSSIRTMVMELNASDERGINVVRYIIKEFCQSRNLLNDGVKLVILDECDAMTREAQFSMRRSKPRLLCSHGEVHLLSSLLSDLQPRVPHNPRPPVAMHSLSVPPSLGQGYGGQARRDRRRREVSPLDLRIPLTPAAS